jgi:hypothetical protein
MLSVLFPFPQLDNSAFHRLVRGVDPDDLLARLAERFPIRTDVSIDEMIDRAPGWIGVATGAPTAPGPGPGPGASPCRWSLVELPPPNRVLVDDEPLDIEPVRLGHHVLTPLLGIEEPTPDPRLHYRPGRADAESAAALCPAADEVMFWMRPVPVAQLADLADRGLVMPPKSTYFTPKVQSGLFIRLTDPSLT